MMVTKTKKASVQTFANGMQFNPAYSDRSAELKGDYTYLLGREKMKELGFVYNRFTKSWFISVVKHDVREVLEYLDSIPEVKNFGAKIIKQFPKSIYAREHSKSGKGKSNGIKKVAAKGDTKELATLKKQVKAMQEMINNFNANDLPF